MAAPDRATPPTTELLDLLGRRWVLRILWELQDEPLGFGELQARCDGMSTSVLSQRLGELRDAGLVQHSRPAGYSLTEPASRLLARLNFFDEWAQAWAAQWRRAARVRKEPTEQGGKR